MIIKKLTAKDLDLLVKLRIDFLINEKIEFTEEEFADIKQKSREFFVSAFEENRFLAYVAEKDNEILSAAFLVISDRPPRKAFTSFQIGTLYNVFTYEKHRRQGIATNVVTAILDEAKTMDISTSDLLATAEGKALYKKMGFAEINCTPMRKKL